jgi:hypothetical protein
MFNIAIGKKWLYANPFKNERSPLDSRRRALLRSVRNYQTAGRVMIMIDALSSPWSASDLSLLSFEGALPEKSYLYETL